MIIKNSKRTGISRQKLFWTLGAFVTVVFLLILIQLDWDKRGGVGEKKPNSDEVSMVFSCDAEQVVTVDSSIRFKSGNHLFGNAETKDDRYARSGRYACRLDQNRPFGFTFDLPSPIKPGEQYEVSVWRYRSQNLKVEQGGKLIVHFMQSNDFRSHDKIDKIGDDGWEKLVYRFVIPVHFKGGTIRIYALHKQADPVWYDDIEIKKFSNKKSAFVLAAEDTSFQLLDLRVTQSGMKKLKAKRKEAFRKWLLVTAKDDWVKGKIGQGDETLKVKLRLKGDLLDHLHGNKWSFRIRSQSSKSWNRMATFSVQSPATRNYLSEWLYHQFLQKEDVLCPRYDFVRLFVNGENRGPYAYEEHFEKQLVEYRGRREGPIVKFTEDAMWQARRRDLRNNLEPKTTEQQLNQYAAAEVAPFRESKTLTDSTLAAQFELAKSLMTAYQYGQKSVDEVFDLDRLARYYAITDIFKAHHGTIWHNQRFYYNPVLSKLEPIGYDGFVLESHLSLHGRPFILFQLASLEGNLENDLVDRLFFDPEFVEKYVSYLWAYSTPGQLKKFFLDLDKAIYLREALIQEQYTNYQLDRTVFYQSARQIRGLLMPMANALRAHRQPDGKLYLANSHVVPLRVVGYASQKRGKSQQLEKPIWLKPHQAESPLDFQEFSLGQSVQLLYYEIPGIDSLFQIEISNQALALPSTPSQELFADIDLKSNSIFQIAGEKILFLAGDHHTETDIVIPKGYQLSFEPGFSLDLQRGAAFISRSPVHMLASAEKPIRIYSSDKSARGFSLLQAPGRSEMRYVRFEGLNTLIKSEWKLTGAVTFYESDVDIQHCAFVENVCEDGLNLIRCDFSLSQSLIAYTFADGLDTDFCTGKINHCTFVETGNDGMDFSGSQIELANCEVVSPGDKGISVGEEATVHILSVKISNAILGIASKDLSKLKIDFILFEACQIGFSAYQKKPEYGPAQIEVKTFEAQEVKRLHLIEKGSVLRLEGNEVETL